MIAVKSRNELKEGIDQVAEIVSRELLSINSTREVRIKSPDEKIGQWNNFQLFWTNYYLSLNKQMLDAPNMNNVNLAQYDRNPRFRHLVYVFV